MCMYRDTSEKWGLSYTNPDKWGQSYTFAWKKGANHILGSAEKGDAHPYYAIYRKLPLPLPAPPPPPPRPHPPPRRDSDCRGLQVNESREVTVKIGLLMKTVFDNLSKLSEMLNTIFWAYFFEHVPHLQSICNVLGCLKRKYWFVYSLDCLLLLLFSCMCLFVYFFSLPLFFVCLFVCLFCQMSWSI